MTDIDSSSDFLDELDADPDFADMWSSVSALDRLREPGSVESITALLDRELEALRRPLALRSPMPALDRLRAQEPARVDLRPETTPSPRPVSLQLWLFFVLWFVMAGVTLLVAKPGVNAIDITWSILWSMYLPLALAGLWGAGHRRRHGRTIALSTYPGRTCKQVIIQIPTLCRPGNMPALARVLTSILEHADSNLDDWRVDVVIDEGDERTTTGIALLRAWLAGRPDGDKVSLVLVPVDYRTPLGSKFKTRANHYAMEQRRAAGENTPATLVYHLDDDSGVGPDTICSLAEFAECSDALLGQGILAFPHELSPSWIARMADSVRPGDDVTRFYLFTGVLGTPAGGLHGEHLVVRADIEDEIGWDFPDTVIEDSHFAVLFATRYPGRATALNSYSYGAPPASVRGLIAQRRRWTEGLVRLVLKSPKELPVWRRLPLAYAVLFFMTAPAQFLALSIILALLLGEHLTAVSSSVLVIWALNLAFQSWQYLLGYRINKSVSADTHTPWWGWLLGFPLLYVLAAVESIGIMSGLLRLTGFKAQRESEVIDKPM